MRPSRQQLRAIALVATLGVAACVRAGSGEALLGQYADIKPALATSQFKRPLLLESTTSPGQPRGDVYAVVDHPFAVLAQALRNVGNWCDILILPFNVKRCVVSGGPSGAMLQLAVGTRASQPPDEAQQIQFRYGVPAAQESYLSVSMAADRGPLGTSDYKLQLEAAPLDARRSFVHMSYSYVNGVAARLATNAYLGSAGRDKVGFSITGVDAAGKAVYVDGLQGVAERNTMRYFLAIEAFLQSLSAAPEQRTERRLHEWFAATERHPRQLREMSLDDYLRMKRREIHSRAAPAPLGGG